MEEKKTQRFFVKSFPEEVLAFAHAFWHAQPIWKDTYYQVEKFDDINKDLKLEEKRAKQIALRGDALGILTAAVTNLQALQNALLHITGFEDGIQTRGNVWKKRDVADMQFSTIEPNFTIHKKIKEARHKIAASLKDDLDAIYNNLSAPIYKMANKPGESYALLYAIQGLRPIIERIVTDCLSCAYQSMISLLPIEFLVGDEKKRMVKILSAYDSIQGVKFSKSQKSEEEKIDNGSSMGERHNSSQSGPIKKKRAGVQGKRVRKHRKKD